MNRRDTALALVVLGVAPFTSFAQQQAPKVARIGFLGAATASSWAGNLEGLRAGLRDLGYVEGKNLVIEFRWAEGRYARLPELAADLVGLKVDVIVTHGTPGTLAAKRATTTIPIVMATSADAVASEIVVSLARPGGNITGLTYFHPQLTAKRLELLKSVMPRITQVAALLNPDNAANGPLMKAMDSAAQLLKLRLQPFYARRPGEFDALFSAMKEKYIEAVLVFEDPIFFTNVKLIADLATRNRLLSAGYRESVKAGGLIGYGVDFPKMFYRAATFVDRIIKGTQPADLPVEQPTRFELVINLKTAQIMGITIPQSVLASADELIR